MRLERYLCTCYAPVLQPASLSESAFLHEFEARPGLIPLRIDCSEAEGSAPLLTWIDLDRYHCYESFFWHSVDFYSALLPAPPLQLSTSIDVLQQLNLKSCLPPTAFIFHGGRCGSTLLARAISRSRENMVFSEAAPHNLVWKVMPKGTEQQIELYRRLILSMGRRRLDSYKNHLIKFTSYNILQFSIIRRAFPETPALFLFRQPEAVLESSAREVQPWLEIDIGFGRRIWHDAALALTDCYEAALQIRDARFRYLDYLDVTPERLPSILRLLEIEPCPEDLALMRSEFFWDAKSGRIPRPFVRKEVKGVVADSHLSHLYHELLDRSRAEPGSVE